MFENILKARKAITDKHGTEKPEEFTTGEVPCPVCEEGQLHYRISGLNGHIHASCTKDGCVNWME